MKRKIRTVQNSIPAVFLLPVLPVLSFYFGIALNALVMAFNHGQMPVLWPTGCGNFVAESNDQTMHSCMTTATHLRVLADWIVLRTGTSSFSVASLGDMFIFLGEKLRTPFIWIWVTVVARASWKQHASNRRTESRVSEKVARRES